MRDFKVVFRDLQKYIENARWFDDSWEIYNRGVYLQLARDNWFNHNQGGIHFETYIEGPEIRRGVVPVHLHAEDDVPQQALFIERFLEEESARLKSWKGYEVVGSGYSICQRNIPIKTKQLADRLFQEIDRLRQLEDTISKLAGELCYR